MTDVPDDAPRAAPPELPKPLVDLMPAVVIGTSAWAAALAVLLVLALGFDRNVDVWLGTAIAGVGLGFVGLGIIAWQRRASRSGSRGAQRGL